MTINTATERIAGNLKVGNTYGWTNYKTGEPTGEVFTVAKVHYRAGFGRSMAFDTTDGGRYTCDTEDVFVIVDGIYDNAADFETIAALIAAAPTVTTTTSLHYDEIEVGDEVWGAVREGGAVWFWNDGDIPWQIRVEDGKARFVL